MKKLQLMIIIVFILFVNSIVIAQYPKWYVKIKKIELLESTYSSVVELYGEPKKSKGERLKTFETKYGDLSITLSTGKCGTEYKKGYDVDVGVVERIEFVIKRKNRVKAKKLGFDLSQFEKFEVHDMPNIFTYEHIEAGIFIGTDNRGRVDDLDFQPSSEFDKLNCNQF